MLARARRRDRSKVGWNIPEAFDRTIISGMITVPG
jgi:hypothetical protein